MQRLKLMAARAWLYQRLHMTAWHTVSEASPCTSEFHAWLTPPAATLPHPYMCLPSAMAVLLPTQAVLCCLAPALAARFLGAAGSARANSSAASSSSSFRSSATGAADGAAAGTLLPSAAGASAAAASPPVAPDRIAFACEATIVVQLLCHGAIVTAASNRVQQQGHWCCLLLMHQQLLRSTPQQRLASTN